MARANTPGAWDFVKVGEKYQYKEDYLIATVKILSDTSDEEKYEFRVRILESNIDMRFNREFTIMARKDNRWTWNDMIQFYEKPEYMPLPLGSSWNFTYPDE